jgi:hypothetical protein
MRMVIPPLAMSLMLAAGAIAPVMAERDLGLHWIHGAVDLIWAARETEQRGTWSAAYAMRGSLDRSADDDETLLAGWSFRCDGTMSGASGRIEQDAGTCLFEDGGENRVFARFSVAPGPWASTALRIGFFGGTGLYRTLHGEGTIERRMHLPLADTTGWGFLTGTIAWHRD